MTQHRLVQSKDLAAPDRGAFTLPTFAMRNVRKLGSALLLTSVFLAGCRDDAPTVSPSLVPAPSGPVAARLQCAVTVSSGSMSCEPASASGAAALTVGGQATYVFLKASNVVYTSGTSTFAADVTIQNLMAQKLGTTDGTTVSGVKAYVVEGPTTTGGSGTITVQNADGTGTLTASGQSFFNYSEIIDAGGGLSSVKNWKFTVPSTVTTFTFGVLLQGSIPEESNYLRFAIENGMNLAIYKMYGADSRNIFAAYGGTVYRYNGLDWRTAGTNLGATLWGISGTSAKDVWAVGSNGTALRYNGTTWASPASTGTTQFLNGVWANTTTDVWAVGDSGAVFRFTGASWAKTQVAALTTPLRAIKGRSSSDVWAVGDNGNIWHFNGAIWSQQSSGVTTSLQDVLPLSATDIWVVGYSGTILHNTTGTSWSPLTMPTVTGFSNCDVTAISAVSATDIWGSTGCYDAIHYTGTSWAAAGAAVNGYGYMNSIYAASATDVWMSAWGDRPLHYNGTTWREVGNYSQPNIYAMWGAGPYDVWAGTSTDVLWHRDFFGWTQSSSGLTAATYGLWGSASNNIWAVGRNGGTSRYNGTSWASVASGTTNNLLAVWGTSASNVYAVGNSGTIVKFGGSTWATQTSNTTTDLYDVAGSGASDIWAVGAGGFITHFNGTTWASTSSPVTVPLFGVCVNSSTDAWAVGDLGKIIRWNGSIWATVSNPATTAAQFYDVWCGSSTNIWATTVEGLLYHYDGSSWKVLPTGSGFPVWVIYGFSSDLYAGGNYGFIVHGTR